MSLKVDNTTYYYFTGGAFKKKYKKIFKNDTQFIVSNFTLKNVESDEELEWNLFTLKNLFRKWRASSIWRHIKTWNMDVVMHKPKYFEPIDKKLKEFEGVYKVSPYDKIELAAAVYFDTHIRPDQVVFVCDDVKLAHAANLFFGSDSIILIK